MIDIRRAIAECLPRDLLLDLEDRLAAEALKAFEVVRDHIPLNAKRGREAVGQIRFRLQEQGFEEVVAKHGGTIIEDGCIPGTDLKVFQPFARFAGGPVGVILGFASMPEPRKVPPKNQSRNAGVTVNFHLQPRLDFDGSAPKPSDIFVLFLVSRDRQRAGLIEEVAIGVIDSGYEDFIFYEPLDRFLTDYISPPSPAPDGGGDDGGPAVRLRALRKPFIKPEDQPSEGGEEGGAAG